MTARLLLFLFPSLLCLTACAVPPVSTTQQARESGQRAIESKARIYAPRAFREYEYAMVRARRFQMEEDTRLIPAFRNYTVTLEAYRLARQKGDAAQRESVQKQQELAVETQGRILHADAELADIRETVTGVPIGGRSSQSLGEADVLISAAQRLLNQGEYLKAQAAAEKALEKVALVENRASYVLDRYTRPDLLEKWRRWVRETVDWSRENNAYAVIVDKSRHTCMVYYAGSMRKSYAVNLGVNGFNQKYRAGDLATPEGRYKIVKKQDFGQSRYYKGLLLNYPNDEDWQRFYQAKRERFISGGSNIGGLIMIHGDGRKNVDWTQGCVAMENKSMDEVYEWVDIGTPITIVGRDTTPMAEMASIQPDVVDKVTKRNGKGF